MNYGFGGNYTDILRHRLGQFPQAQGIPQGGLPFEGGYSPYGGYKGGGGFMGGPMGGFPNPLARLQPFLGRRKRPGMGLVRPY